MRHRPVGQGMKLLLADRQNFAEIAATVPVTVSSSGAMASLLISSARILVSAVTVRVRGAPVISDISPTTSPHGQHRDFMLRRRPARAP